MNTTNQNNEHEDVSNDEMTYSDMYANILLAEEITFVIPAEDVEKTKIGIKNCKARQTAKDKEDGLPVDKRALEFSTKESKEYKGAVELTISYKKAGITVFKTIIPEKF